MKDPPSATTRHEEVKSTRFKLQSIVQFVFTFLLVSKRSVSTSVNDAMDPGARHWRQCGRHFHPSITVGCGEAGVKDVSSTWIAVDRTCELLEGELAIMMADKEGAELAPPISTALLLSWLQEIARGYRNIRTATSKHRQGKVNC